MIRLSTREAAKKLGIDHSTLAKYLAGGKLAPPETLSPKSHVIAEIAVTGKTKESNRKGNGPEIAEELRQT